MTGEETSEGLRTVAPWWWTAIQLINPAPSGITGRSYRADVSSSQFGFN